MSILKVIYYPDTRLREKSRNIIHFDSELTKFAQDLADTMYEYRGIGLASVQVADLRRLFVLDVDWRDEDEDGKKPKKKPEFYINPEIIHKEGEITFEEGCLSIPKVYGEIVRAEQIRVRYQNLEGKTVEADLEAVRAIAFQHELDHLNGVLFFDHLSAFKRRHLIEKYQKLQIEASQSDDEKMNPRYKVVFWGSPDFAVKSLEAVNSAAHVLGVITQPDKPRGRGHTVLPTPVKAKALQLGLPVFSPASLRKECPGRDEALDFLKNSGADFFVVVAYGNLLPQKVLEFPRLACVNVHASLLPLWRGAAPIQRSIEMGDRETGVSLQKMVQELDAGDVLLEERTSLGPNENAMQLSEKLAGLGAKILDSFLRKDFSSIIPKKQDASKVTSAAKITKEEAVWNSSWTSEVFHNKVRAFRAWPVVRIKWPLDNPNGMEIKILETRIHPQAIKEAFKFENEKFLIKTESSDSCVEILQAQIPGKGPSSGTQVLRKLDENVR